MRKIKKKLQNLFKSFFYKIYTIIYGNIVGKINYDEDDRIQIDIVEKNKSLKYKIYKIKNARLYTDTIHDAAVILNNSIVDGPSYQLRKFGPPGHETVNNAPIEENIVFNKGTPRIKKKIKGKVLSLLTGGAGNDNYWHWIFDVLPRIALCEKILNLNELDFFLLPSLEKKFQRETLELLNIPKSKCISSKFFRHISSNEMIVTEHPYLITNDGSNDIQNIPIWIFEWLKKKYIKSDLIQNTSLPKKIYIDRSDSSSNTRNLRLIINESEVKSFLIDNGLKSIALGNLHFKEQVELFNNAEFIIGLHGGGFSNLSFCKKNTKVLELKNTTDEKVIENLALNNDLIYKSIKSEAVKFKFAQFGHINVSINSLKKEIDNFG